MVKVMCGDNLHRDTKMISPDTTIAAAMQKFGVNYDKGITSLNGTPLMPGDFEKTFEQFGVTTNAYLLNVVKADNA